jgi:calcium-binding protein CML
MSHDDLATHLREVFGFFEQSGLMSLDHLPTAVRAMDLNPSDKQLSDWKKQVDSNGTGSIDFAAFSELVTEHLDTRDTREAMLHAFKVLDKTGSGVVHTKELRALLTSMGERYTDEEFDALVAFDDRDGVINYAALTDRMLTPFRQLRADASGHPTTTTPF